MFQSKYQEKFEEALQVTLKLGSLNFRCWFIEIQVLIKTNSTHVELLISGIFMS